MKRIKKTTITILVIILLSNLPPIRWFNYFYVQNYTYSNYNGGFVSSENYGKGGSYANVLANFNHYKQDNPGDRDKQLYRTFTFQPWRFWDWYQYLGKGRERFWLPYLSQTEIENNRKASK